jgi:hypothetical protein
MMYYDSCLGAQERSLGAPLSYAQLVEFCSNMPPAPLLW